MATSGTNPTSALLQDMLREKKAQTQRVKKTYDPTDGQKNGRDDRDIQSSPIASMSARDRSDAQNRRGSGIGVRSATMPKEMGFKEMEEHMSRLNKQNFDLKLEVFHRRQRNEVLENKLEKLQALEGDNEELQSINEELLLELEKRDVAIQEAVGLICELEAKNEELQMAVVKMDFTHTSDPEPAKEGNGIMASSLSTISGTEHSKPSHTGIDVPTNARAPAEHSLSAPDTLSPPKAASARRVPSFMRDIKKSTNVLRSMYSSDGNASFVSLTRPVSLFSGEDDDDYIDRQITNSPRLSLLSTSGFSSIYGGNKDQNTGAADEEWETAKLSFPKRSISPPQRNPQRESRLHKWLDQKALPRTPSPKSTAKDKVASISEVLSQVHNSSRDRNTAETPSAGQQPREQQTPEKRKAKESRSPEKTSTSPSFGGPIFGGAVLPPTPDTMSTATLDANSSTPSIITEKSLLDGTPYPAKGYLALIPDIRPHTSDSTNESSSPTSSRNATRQDTKARSDAPGVSGSGAPTRPSLTTSGTDTFSGESLASTQASRTLSYPSPTSRARRLSDQRSPKSYRGSDSNSEMTANQSQQDRPRSGSGATMTFARRTARDDHRSPLSSQDSPVLSPITALPHLGAGPPAQRSSSLRAKIASKFSRSTNNATRIPNPSSNYQDCPPSRPPVTRASTQHACLPRPASLYGQQHPVPTPNPSPTYAMSPIIAKGTLTDLERYSAESPRNVERHRDRR